MYTYIIDRYFKNIRVRFQVYAYQTLPVINDTSNELIPDEALLQREDVLETLEQFEVKESRLVEEFDFLIYDFDMFLELSVPCSVGCFRNMYGKDDIIVLMMCGQYSNEW